eukprot:TRINITY_DN57662_c0_g1_i1.p1 TRINITY_DN57662_c0_g1~~TRINITY_DN57662_c0_g1_i1.p1  ORF type:complete len:550 (-),score=60.83 TRINITY_DN57662_c0_g1_i1:254-1903(-)
MFIIAALVSLQCARQLLAVRLRSNTSETDSCDAKMRPIMDDLEPCKLLEDSDQDSVCDALSEHLAGVGSDTRRSKICDEVRRKVLSAYYVRFVQHSRGRNIRGCCDGLLERRHDIVDKGEGHWLKARAMKNHLGHFKKSGARMDDETGLRGVFDKENLLAELKAFFHEGHDVCAGSEEDSDMLRRIAAESRVLHFQAFMDSLNSACGAADTEAVQSLKARALMALSQNAALTGQSYKSEIYDNAAQKTNHWTEIEGRLKTGDLIFSEGLGWHSQVINKVSKGETSHIGMVVKPLGPFIGKANSNLIRERFKVAGDTDGSKAHYFLSNISFAFEADYGYERRLTADPVRDAQMCRTWAPSDICDTWALNTTNGLGLAPLWNKMLDEEEDGLTTKFIAFRFLKKPLNLDQVAGLHGFYADSHCKRFDMDAGVIVKSLIMKSRFTTTWGQLKKDPDAQYFCSAAVARAFQNAGLLPWDQRSSEVKKYFPQFFYGDQVNEAMRTLHHGNYFEPPRYLSLAKGNIPLFLPLYVPFRGTDGAWACREGFGPTYDD